MHLSGLEFKWQERTEKNRRLEALEPFMSSGHLYIKLGSEELEGELEAYPRNKKSPNILDGLYFSTRRLIKPQHLSENYHYEPEYTDDEAMYISRHGTLETAKGYLAA